MTNSLASFGNRKTQVEVAKNRIKNANGGIGTLAAIDFMVGVEKAEALQKTEEELDEEVIEDWDGIS